MVLVGVPGPSSSVGVGTSPDTTQQCSDTSTHGIQEFSAIQLDSGKGFLFSGESKSEGF